MSKYDNNLTWENIYIVPYIQIAMLIGDVDGKSDLSRNKKNMHLTKSQ